MQTTLKYNVFILHDNNMRKISTYMLFTVSQLLIPISLQIYYDIYPLYLSLIGLFSMGIFYHNHLIKTNDNPYIIYRLIDMIFVGIASLLIFIYGKKSLNTIIIASGAPIFYFFSKIFKNNMLHSIVHVSSISAFTHLIFHIKNKEIDTVDIIIIVFSSYLGILVYINSMKFFGTNEYLKEKKIKRICDV